MRLEKNKFEQRRVHKVKYAIKVWQQWRWSINDGWWPPSTILYSAHNRRNKTTAE